MDRPTVAFLESAGQASAVLRLQPRPDILIALAPFAAYHLEQANVAYWKAEDCYDETALLALSEPAAQAEASWVAWVDDWLSERVPEFERAGYRPAQLYFYHLKLLFDAVRIRAFILQAVAKALTPGRAIYFAPDAFAAPRKDLRLHDSMNARCLPQWASSHGITLERLPPAGDERFERPPYVRRLTAAAARRKLEEIASLAYSRWRARRGPLGGRNVLIRPEYDVRLMLGPLAEQGLRPVAWNRFAASLGAVKSTLPAVPFEEVAGLPRFYELAHNEDLDFSGVVEAPLKRWWSEVLPEGWGAYQASLRRMKDDGIAAVVTPVAGTAVDLAVIYAARAARIPVTIYQHGGFAGSCRYEMWEHTDLAYADSFLAYGDGIMRHYAERLGARTPSPVIVPVGSARLEALARAKPDRAAIRREARGGDVSKPAVLYFPTMHPAYTRYLCGGEMPDVSHWELQRDVIRLFKRFPAVRLWYRPFEGAFASPAEELLRREMPEARVVRDASLPELTWAADAVIADIPSTGLLEALLTDRPIQVLADSRCIRLMPEAKELLERRATVAQTASEFLGNIERMLDRREWAPVASADRAFLDAYGSPGEGSARRAAAAVARTVAGRQ